MTTYLKQLLVNWNVCRIVRIAGGLPIMIMGITKGDWPSTAFGAAFVAAGLFSLQCCATGVCRSLPSNHKQEPVVEYEEIK